jgi:hypothetical protein
VGRTFLFGTAVLGLPLTACELIAFARRLFRAVDEVAIAPGTPAANAIAPIETSNTSLRVILCLALFLLKRSQTPEGWRRMLLAPFDTHLPCIPAFTIESVGDGISRQTSTQISSYCRQHGTTPAKQEFSKGLECNPFVHALIKAANLAVIGYSKGGAEVVVQLFRGRTRVEGRSDKRCNHSPGASE